MVPALLEAPVDLDDRCAMQMLPVTQAIPQLKTAMKL